MGTRRRQSSLSSPSKEFHRREYTTRRSLSNSSARRRKSEKWIRTRRIDTAVARTDERKLIPSKFDGKLDGSHVHMDCVNCQRRSGERSERLTTVSRAAQIHNDGGDPFRRRGKSDGEIEGLLVENVARKSSVRRPSSSHIGRFVASISDRTKGENREAYDCRFRPRSELRSASW